MNKAIFLVGGPGSGKDLVLKRVLNVYNIKEFKLEQLNNALKEDLVNNFIVISTNAYNLGGIVSAKKVLESLQFETSMIYVDVNQKTSKKRLSKRNNISEETLAKKLKESKKNIKKFSSVFENFILFNNDCNIELNPETNNLFLFCEFFIEQKQFFESKSAGKKVLDKRSLKKALVKSNYPLDLYTKIKTDRIGDEYGVRDSGMGFPSTVGPFYNESFAEYEPEIPSFTSNSVDQRSMVPMDAYPEDRSIQRNEKIKTLVKRIKKTAKDSWSKGN